MHRTDDSLASQQSRSALPLLFRPDFLRRRINFNECSVTVGNSGAVLTGAGGLTLSRSRRPFRTAYLCFILIKHRYSLHSDRYARAAHMFYLRGLSTACVTMLSRLADIIYDSQTEQAGCDEWQSRIRIEQSVDWSTFNSFFLFLYYAYSIILNDRLCRIYLFFSAALFTVLTARC